MKRRRNLLFVILASLGVVQLLYLNFVETDRLFVLSRDVVRLEADVSRLEAEQAELLATAGRADDVVFREQLARKQGFILPDELRIVTDD